MGVRSRFHSASVFRTLGLFFTGLLCHHPGATKRDGLEFAGRSDLLRQPGFLERKVGRRAFLAGAGAAGLAGLTSPLVAACGQALEKTGRPSSRASRTPIKHLVIDLQENRSFDHYYGFAPFAGSYGVPAHYAQPDGMGGSVAPYHLASLSSTDIGHTWGAVRGGFDAGRMDGFFTTGGLSALGYYTAADLPFYYTFSSRRHFA
jgi:phospholipase C